MVTIQEHTGLSSSLPCADFDRWVTACWRTDCRYYQADIMQDLFGIWLFKRSWGGIGSRRRQSIIRAVDHYDHAVKLLNDVAHKRRKRGYVVCP